ncbi:hypothetical protein FHS90_000421 [Rufibacter quisquiliarum]|uniref:Uncharacterized protein n=1 Tax=Rufibacter quisquiliarum TaxID=1549639 RepID=A0A839G8F2_9BACT|nr:hypothetical protein [Rufibacter quisquiliarum]
MQRTVRRSKSIFSVALLQRIKTNLTMLLQHPFFTYEDV